MKLDLSSFKQNHPEIEDYFSYIESMVANNGEADLYQRNLPYPDNLQRFYRLMPLPIFYPFETEKFKSLMVFTGEWIKKLHESFPPQSVINMIASNYPEIHKSVSEELGVDFFTFISCRLMEALHLSHKSPTIHYHEDLFKMLRMTDVKRSCDVPVTAIKVPYKSVYLDWRDLATEVKGADGAVYQGCYVQSYVTTYEKMNGTHLFKYDPSLRESVQKGLIKPDKELMFFNMEFVEKCDDPDRIQNMLFSVACSIDDSIKLTDAMFSHEEIEVINKGNTAFADMEEPIGLVISTLMYMNTKDAFREEFKEASGMALKIKELKNATKKRKALSRLNKSVYDYVRIGKTFKLEGVDNTASGAGSKKSAHMRLGYFNQYYIGHKLKRNKEGDVIRDSEGNGIEIPKEEREIEVKWIMPTLVNAETLKDVEQKKDRKLF